MSERDTVRAEFASMTAALIKEEADDLLDKHLARVAEWRRERLAHGDPAELRDLISQIHQERNQRGPVLAAYAAAMWRLMEQEDPQ